jgi:Plavaka transposase
MVHDVGCFAWSHPYTNIHTAMMVDMLHQLLKGVIHYLIDWIKSHLSATITRKRKRDADGNIALQDRWVGST